MKRIISAVLVMLLSVTTVFGASNVAYAAEKVTFKEQIMAVLSENLSKNSLLDEEMLLLVSDVLDIVLKEDPVIDEKEYAALYRKVSNVTATVDSTTNYLSVGGSYSAVPKSFDKYADEYVYGQIVANEYGLGKKQYTEIGQAGYRAEELLYILDSGFAGDEYSKTVMKDSDRLNYRTKYTSSIQKADVITVALGSDSFTTYMSKQLMSIVASGVPSNAFNWSLYLDANGINQVNRLIAEMKAYLVENGFGAYANMATALVECYAYAFIGYTYCHEAVVNKIHEINPEAQVIILGMYNVIDGIVYATEEKEIAVGAYADYFVKLTNSQLATYAANTENTFFVEIEDATTSFDGKQVISFGGNTEDMIGSLSNIVTAFGLEKIRPDVEGHKYIANQIITAINEVPEEPEVDEPEVPDTPIVPDEPVVPDTPEVPDEPVVPDEPEVPDTPVVPDEPEVEDPIVKGDFNGDGKVTLADVMILDRYLAGWKVELNEKAADFNGDGKATLADVMILDRFLAGWPITL